MFKALFNHVKKLGRTYRTLQAVNRGELRITKKGKVKKPKRK